ncbi:hypothetical protein QL285_038140 [Trifolium repens]|nr:hypothetical protein QL285_038140 [Trifolium repens]
MELRRSPLVIYFFDLRLPRRPSFSKITYLYLEGLVYIQDVEYLVKRSWKFPIYIIQNNKFFDDFMCPISIR